MYEPSPDVPWLIISKVRWGGCYYARRVVHLRVLDREMIEKLQENKMGNKEKPKKNEKLKNRQ